MNLVIVESPTKSKTIKRFLGRNYRVIASFGHIRDLPKGKLGIDIKKGFIPQYVIPQKAKKTVSFLKNEAQKAKTIILATDEDREGEAIAWHIARVLGLVSKSGRQNSDDFIKRIVFHEITKEAILKALKNPRQINVKMVDAQKARRVLDRLVGYKLSPFLWKKIARGLSAGRVQSVAVRLVCEREDEIKKFQSKEYWTILASFCKTKNCSEENAFKATLTKIEGKTLRKFDISNKKDAQRIKKNLEKAIYRIQALDKKEISKSPLPPYITSTLQQDAAMRLGFSPKKTMFLAQRLYEGVNLGGKGSTGLITYMRTDSVNLAEGFLKQARQYLKKNFAPPYFSGSRRFQTKNKNAQEAHEAIRPTNINYTPKAVKLYLEKDVLRLYELIWQRALASQMSPAVFETTKVIINSQNEKKYQLEAKGEIKKFDGFLRVYPLQKKETLLPRLEKSDSLKLLEVSPVQKFTQPPARYNAATLIKTLEKYGIGRPSTYAPIISTIQERGYVIQNGEKRFEPTEVGIIVNNLLLKYFKDIVDYKFTAKMEEDLDKIANGKKKWVAVVKNFYIPFSRELLLADKEAKDKKERQRKIGKKCPLCGAPLVERFSKYGKFIACSNYPKCKYIEPSNSKQKSAPRYSDKRCPKCGGRLIYRKSRYGEFLGCENYPKCKYVEPIVESTGILCPKCGKGEIIKKYTKKGRPFYGCSNYPECKFALWNKPTGEKCPKCGALLVENAKGKIFCSNKLCDYKKK